MLIGLLDTPKDFSMIIRQYVIILLIYHQQNTSDASVTSAIAGSAMTLAYGIPIKLRDDPFVHLAQEAVQEIIDSLSPAKFLVNLLPALKYVPEFTPGAGFRKKANDFKNNLAPRVLSEPFCATVNAIVSSLWLKFTLIN